MARPVHGPSREAVLGPPLTAGWAKHLGFLQPGSPGFSLGGFSLFARLKPNNEKPRKRGWTNKAHQHTRRQRRAKNRFAESPVNGATNQHSLQ